MTARARWRGHAISYLGDAWVYDDTGRPVAEDPDRPCGHCGMANTPEGYDGCIGEIPGATNACCGHGDPGDAYVQYESETA